MVGRAVREATLAESCPMSASVGPISPGSFSRAEEVELSWPATGSWFSSAVGRVRFYSAI